jgi:hypothetical protein
LSVHGKFLYFFPKKKRVLHHLKRKELEKSLTGLYNLLKEYGILFYTFRYGEKEEFIDGLRYLEKRKDLKTTYNKTSSADISVSCK